MNTPECFCPICGAANPPGAVHCAVCGVALMGATPVPAQAVPSSPVLPVGHVLKGRYRLVAQVGQGGYGYVYKAEDTDQEKQSVAVKEMHSSGLSAQEAQEATAAFHQEAALLGSLAHPNLPRIHDQFTEGGHAYLVMDFIAGKTLEERQKHVTEKRLPAQEVLRIGIQVCDVLEYLHSQQPPIIFRDLKPANIMLTRDGQLFLIDFGIARHFKPGQAKDTVAFGTAGYAAPEQYGRAQTTPRSDIYSLGAVLHRMLTGRDPAAHPFHFGPLKVAAPAGLEQLIWQMVSLDAHKRPSSAAEVRETLQEMEAAWEKKQQAKAEQHAPHSAPAHQHQPVLAHAAAPQSARRRWQAPKQSTRSRVGVVLLTFFLIWLCIALLLDLAAHKNKPHNNGPVSQETAAVETSLFCEQLHPLPSHTVFM